MDYFKHHSDIGAHNMMMWWIYFSISFKYVIYGDLEHRISYYVDVRSHFIYAHEAFDCYIFLALYDVVGLSFGWKPLRYTTSIVIVVQCASLSGICGIYIHFKNVHSSEHTISKTFESLQ